MNCKPGDIAVIIGVSKFAGMIVEVLYFAPIGSFALPDGYPACNESEHDCWVVKSLGSQFNANLNIGDRVTGQRKTMYGFGADRKMRPIRGIEDGESTQENIKLPKTEKL